MNMIIRFMQAAVLVAILCGTSWVAIEAFTASHEDKHPADQVVRDELVRTLVREKMALQYQVEYYSNRFEIELRKNSSFRSR